MTSQMPFQPVPSTSYVSSIPIHPAAAAVLARPQWVQRTEAWYAVRREFITASDAAAAIGIPPFKSYKGCPRTECMTKKLDNLPLNNIFVAHGQRYENEALALAMEALGDIAYECGLVRHPTLPWIAASPDGITHTGRCIEIKCPLKRKIIPGEVPHHYYPQVQTQMEVTGLEETVFIEYKPAFASETGARQLSIVVVQRDRAWFAKHRDALHDFWSEYVQRQRTHIPPPPPPPPTCLIDDALYADALYADALYADALYADDAQPSAKRRCMIDDALYR